jgi:CheY-like chemotaxis protein
MPPPKPSLYIVDDEPDQVQLHALAAERCGEFGWVGTATEPQLAYDWLLEVANDPGQRPHLVVIDWKMRGMHGSVLAQALREHASLAEIPVVALSNSGDPRDRNLALKHGCRAFHEKPAGLEPLTDLFRELCAKHCVGKMDVLTERRVSH